MYSRKIKILVLIHTVPALCPTALIPLRTESADDPRPVSREVWFTIRGNYCAEGGSSHCFGVSGLTAQLATG